MILEEVYKYIPENYFFAILTFLVLMLLAKIINSKLLPYTEQLLKSVSNKGNIQDFAADIVTAIKNPVSYFLYLSALSISLHIAYERSVPIEVNYIQYALYTLITINLILNLIDSLVENILERSQDLTQKKEVITAAVKMIKFVITLSSILAYLSTVGVNVTTFIASLGIGGMAVALAAKDTAANFFGSIQIFADKSFSVGHWIKTPKVEGTVIDIGIRSTKIWSFQNTEITIPNSVLSNDTIENFSKRKNSRRIKETFGISYNAKRENLKNAIKEIKDMLINHPDIATKEKIEKRLGRKLYYNSLISEAEQKGIKWTLLVDLVRANTYSLDINVYCFTITKNWEEWRSIQQDVIFKVWEILEKNDLEFAFPTQTIHLEK